MINKIVGDILNCQHPRKVLTLLVGESGSGKTVVADFLKNIFGMRVLQSYTTRPPRCEGEDGHIFVSEEEFEALENKVAYTEFDGYKYCATKAQIEESDIYIIDPDGIETLKKYKEENGLDKELLTIMIYANPYLRAARMEARGDDDKMIADRIENDVKKFENITYDFALINGLNDPIEKVGLQIFSIISMVELDNYYQGESECMTKLP